MIEIFKKKYKKLNLMVKQKFLIVALELVMDFGNKKTVVLQI